MNMNLSSHAFQCIINFMSKYKMTLNGEPAMIPK